MFKYRGHDAVARSRWAAVGAAVAVALGAGGAGWVAHAGPAAVQSVFVSITPCRLFDTRPADQVAERGAPLTTGETWVRQVWGVNGRCNIPNTASAIAYNLTIPDPVVTGFITVFPADAALPGSSSINPVANGGTKANSGIVGLSATGAINLFNHDGPINALLDITGYYLPGSGGAPGATGPRGFSAWDTIPSGQTVTGEIIYDTQSGGGALSDGLAVNLPGVAPQLLDAAHVNFGKASFALDQDLACDGDAATPTAPAGMVCIYLDSVQGIDQASLQGDVYNLKNRAFYVLWMPSTPAAAGDDEYLYASWAYTAP